MSLDRGFPSFGARLATMVVWVVASLLLWTPSATGQEAPFEGQWRFTVHWCKRDGADYERLAQQVRDHLAGLAGDEAWSFIRTDADGVPPLDELTEEDITERTWRIGRPGPVSWDPQGMEVRWGGDEEEEAAWLLDYLEATFAPNRFKLRELRLVEGDNRISISLCEVGPGEAPPAPLASPPVAGTSDMIAGADAVSLARRCARESNGNVRTFAECTDSRMVIRPEHEALIRCLEEHGRSDTEVASCAGPLLLSNRLDPDQERSVRCAWSARNGMGDLQACLLNLAGTELDFSREEAAAIECGAEAEGAARVFLDCMRLEFSEHSVFKGQWAPLACAWDARRSRDAFERCMAEMGLSAESGSDLAVLQCAMAAKENSEAYLACAAPKVLGGLPEPVRAAFQCGLPADGERSLYLRCAAQAFLGQQFSPEQAAVFDCAFERRSLGRQATLQSFAACAVPRLLGRVVTPEQEAVLLSAAKCAAESNGQAATMASCAATEFLGASLTEEQRIALECVVQGKGQPQATAACAATRLVARELEKCVQSGFGGNGCFGDSHDLVGKNGWVARQIRNVGSDLVDGAGPTNDAFGDEGWMKNNLGFRLPEPRCIFTLGWAPGC